jgi:single-stranded-DNA-specific exonuclease
MQQRKVWVLKPEPPECLFQDLGSIPLPIVRALFHRGIQNAENARSYFSQTSDVSSDPFLLSGMVEASKRLVYAILHQERIAIYGDYDADGVTATAILTDFLRKLGAEAQSYIPSRFEEGYGLNISALASLQEQGVRLVVSVDCGARSVAEADYARQIGLDLIITDHHAPGEIEPNAIAFVDPKRRGDLYPDKDLAGVGVAYKLVQACIRQFKREEIQAPISANDYIDLVALGTVADMVPLRGENRSLVKAGLARLNGSSPDALRPGVEALLQTAGVKRGGTTASAIGFMLAPRLNAAGRLETATCALDLLLANDSHRAQALAADLSSRNRKRQELARETFLAARLLVLGTDEAATTNIPILLMAEHADFNPGIIGLAASRLVDEFFRPSILVTIEGEFARGSARSIPGFHITEALDSIGSLFERYGGHAAAAGFTVRTERLPVLRQELLRLAGEALSGQTLTPEISIDSEITMEDLNWNLHNFIHQMEPCGQGNPSPLFLTRRMHVLNKRVIGQDARHLKLTFSEGKRSIDAIAFGRGADARSLPTTLDVVFALEEDNYYEKKLQMRIVDMAESEV